MLISSDRKFSWLSSVTRSVRTELRWQECCGVSSVVVNSSSALSRHLQNMVKLDTGNRNPFTAAVQMFPTRRESAGPEPGPESHLDRVQHRHEVIKRFQYFTEKHPECVSANLRSTLIHIQQQRSFQHPKPSGSHRGNHGNILSWPTSACCNFCPKTKYLSTTYTTTATPVTSLSNHSENACICNSQQHHQLVQFATKMANIPKIKATKAKQAYVIGATK